MTNLLTGLWEGSTTNTMLTTTFFFVTEQKEENDRIVVGMNKDHAVVRKELEKAAMYVCQVKAINQQ